MKQESGKDRKAGYCPGKSRNADNRTPGHIPAFSEGDTPKTIKPMEGNMFTKIFMRSLICVFFLTISQSLRAEVPGTMTYQGWLLGSQDVPVTDSLPMSFTIYDDSIGGALWWDESYSTIGIDSGSFSVVLGSQSTIPDTVFTGDRRWLEISINGELISPRVELTSVPYSAHAGAVDGFSPGPMNIDSGNYNFVAGDSNVVTGNYVSIAGGVANRVEANYVTVGGGQGNLALAPPGKEGGDTHAVMAGGRDNQSNYLYTTVSGGFNNIAGNCWPN
jgi:hypothetical protein